MNPVLNLVSLIGIFVLCGVAWLFSENRRVIPWRVIVGGIGLQLLLGFFIFQFPITRELFRVFSGLLDAVFTAADAGARFVFGPNLVPLPGQEPFILRPMPDGAQVCLPPNRPFTPGFCGSDRLNYILAFRALPAVIFFSGLIALLDNLGLIRKITDLFAKVFYRTMGLSGAESLSGAANIFVGIEAAIAVRPFIARMTRSEICAILACCFGTAASSTLAIYVSFLRPVFPNILGHLVSASIIAIPACFVLSKILVPETLVPETLGGIPTASNTLPSARANSDSALPGGDADLRLAAGDLTVPETLILREAVATEPAGEVIERVSPIDAAILGALDGVKMAVSIAAVLILVVGLVSLVNQTFAGLASLKTSTIPLLQWIGQVFSLVTLQNLSGLLFYPLTILTGVQVDPSKLITCLQAIGDSSKTCVPDESWQASVLIGRRLMETAIPSYQALAQARAANLISDRTVLIVSYALSGFAHLASLGIFVGGTIALAPSRRKDIAELGWKALFVGTLATLMIACVAGFYDTGSPSIMGATQSVATPVKPTPALSPLSSLPATITPPLTTWRC